MFSYKDYVESVILRGDFLLETMEETVNKLWIEGKLSNGERDELLQLAADNAKDVLQINIVEKVAEFEQRIYNLEHPVDQFPVWQQGQVSVKGQPYRFDVTGDGELDLVRYDGGRASTSLSIGKIEGWHLLDRELNVVAVITRDADKNFIITPVNTEPEPETDGDSDDANTE